MGSTVLKQGGNKICLYSSAMHARQKSIALLSSIIEVLGSGEEKKGVNITEML